MNMNLLSIIIYDEYSVKLNETIQSVIPFADQIIVISQSGNVRFTKNTEILQLKINSNISKANNLNKAIYYCNSPWILYLNAGERIFISEFLNIRNLILNSHSDCGGFLCKIKSVHSFADGGMYDGFYPRLFLNDSSNESFFKGFLFEQTTFSIIESGKSIYQSDLVIANDSLEDPVKPENAIFILNNLAISNKDIYYWYELGLNYSLIGNSVMAEESFFNVFENNDNQFYCKELTALALSNLCRRQKRFDEAILWAEMAYDLAKDKTYALQAIANAHLWNQDTAKAKIFFTELQNLVSANTYKYYHTTFPHIIIDQAFEDIAKLENL